MKQAWHSLATVFASVLFLSLGTSIAFGQAFRRPANDVQSTTVLFDSYTDTFLASLNEGPYLNPYMVDFGRAWNDLDENIQVKVVLEEGTLPGTSTMIVTLQSQEVPDGFYIPDEGTYASYGSLNQGVILLGLPETVSADLENVVTQWEKHGDTSPTEIFYTTDCGGGDFLWGSLGKLVQATMIDKLRAGQVFNRAMDLGADMLTCELPGTDDTLLDGTLFENENTHDNLLFPWQAPDFETWQGKALTLTLPLQQDATTVLANLDQYGMAFATKFELRAKEPISGWGLSKRLHIVRDDIRLIGEHTPAPAASGTSYWNAPGQRNEQVIWSSLYAQADDFIGDLSPENIAAQYADYPQIKDNIITRISIADPPAGSTAGSVLYLTVESNQVDGGYLGSVDTDGFIWSGKPGSIHLSFPETLAVANYNDIQTWIWETLATPTPVKFTSANANDCSLGIANWLLDFIPGWKLIRWTNGLLGVLNCSLSSDPLQDTSFTQSFTHDAARGGWDLTWELGTIAVSRVQLAIPLTHTPAQAMALLSSPTGRPSLFTDFPMMVWPDGEGPTSAHIAYPEYQLRAGYIFDNVSPTLTNLSADTATPGTIVGQVTAADNLGIDQITFSLVDPLDQYHDCTVTSDPNGDGIWECQWNTNSWESGIYLIQTVAVDLAGNNAIVGDLFNYQRPPDPLISTVTVTADQASYQPGETVVLSVSARDGDSAPVTGATLSFTIGGSPFDCQDSGVNCQEIGSGNYSISFPAPGAAGDYDVVVQASKNGYLPGSGSETLHVDLPGDPGHDVRANYLRAYQSSSTVIRATANVINEGTYPETSAETVRLTFKLYNPSGGLVRTTSSAQFSVLKGYQSDNYSVDLLLPSSPPDGQYTVEATAEIIGYTDADPADNRLTTLVWVGEKPDFHEFGLNQAWGYAGERTNSVDGYSLQILSVVSAGEDSYARVDVYYNNVPVSDGDNARVDLNEITLFDSDQCAVILTGVIHSVPAGAIFDVGRGGSTGVDFTPGTAVVAAGLDAVYRVTGPSGHVLRYFEVDVTDGSDDFNLVSTWDLNDDQLGSASLIDLYLTVPPSASPRVYDYWLSFDDRDSVYDRIIRKLYVEVLPAHNIQLSGLTPSGGSFSTGTSVPIQVTLSNTGGHTEYNLPVVATITGPAGYAYTQSTQVSSLAAGASQLINFSWATGGLAAGTYTLQVNAPLSTDAYPANNTVSASNTLTAPLPLNLTLAVEQASLYQWGRLAFTGTLTSNSSPVDGAGVTYWLKDSNDQTVATGPLSALGGGAYTAQTVAPFQLGSYTLLLTAAKSGYASAQSSSVPLTVSQAPPETEILTAQPVEGAWVSNPAITFSWAGSDLNYAAAQLQYAFSLDGGGWSAYSAATSLSRTWADGAHTLAVRAKNPAGLVDPTPAQRSFTVDTTAPFFESAPTANAATYQDGDTITLEIDMDEIADLTVDFSALDSQFDPANVTILLSDPQAHRYTVQYTIQISNTLSDQAATIQITARDALGNTRTYTGLSVRLENHAPWVTAVWPDGETETELDTTLGVTFSEEMQPAATESAWSLEPTVGGQFGWQGRTLVFTPTLDLTPETTYTVTLSADALDLAGKPLQPHSWAFTTAGRPGAFDKLAPANGAVDVSVSPTLSWEVSAGAESYAYCLDMVLNATCDTGWIGAGTQTSVTLADLASATQFEWQVRATAEGVHKEANGGNWWRFTVQPHRVYLPVTFLRYDPGANLPPQEPANPNPADGAPNQPLAPTLTWTGGDPDGDPVTYDLYLEAGDTTPDVLAAGDLATPSYQAGGLAPNALYYWQVVATDNRGAQTSSPVWSFTTLIPACIPQLISPEQDAILDNGSTDFSDPMIWDFDWSDCAYATAYNLYVKGATASIPLVNVTIGVSQYHREVYSYITYGLRFNWTWKVRALIGGVWGEWSEVRTFDVEMPNTDTNLPPYEPSDPSPADEAVDQPTNLTLSWSGGDPDDAYPLYDVYLDAGDAAPNTLVASNLIATSYQTGPLLPDTHYTWQVVVRDPLTTTLGPVWDFTTAAPLALSFGSETVLDSTFANAYTLEAVDLDEDGDLDLLGAATGSGMAWWRNNGSGAFTKIVIASDGADGITAADIDGDGDLDLAGTLNDALIWWQNDGAENFIQHSLAGLAMDMMVSAADIDGDLDIDLVANNGSTDTVAWWQNDGAQNFTPYVITSGFDLPRDLVVADLDGDLDLDIAGTATVGASLTYWENDGSGSFSTHTIKSSFSGAWSVHAGDLDGDGDVDLAASAYSANDLAWFENDGSGNFSMHLLDGGFSFVRSVVMADVDNDGDLDVVAGATGTDQIAIWRNDGLAGFTKLIVTDTFVDAYGPRSLAVGDLDGDGKPDVAGAGYGEQQVSWWRQTTP